MNYDGYLKDDKKKKKKKKEKNEKNLEEEAILKSDDFYKDYKGKVEEKEYIDDRLVEKKVKRTKKHSLVFINILMAIFTILIIFVIILLFFPGIIN